MVGFYMQSMDPEDLVLLTVLMESFIEVFDPSIC